MQFPFTFVSSLVRTRTVRANRGTKLECRGWVQEAALRMLRNNLDPDVAERPEDLVVYGGSGKAARDWKSFDAIERAHLPVFQIDHRKAARGGVSAQHRHIIAGR